MPWPASVSLLFQNICWKADVEHGEVRGWEPGEELSRQGVPQPLRFPKQMGYSQPLGAGEEPRAPESWGAGVSMLGLTEGGHGVPKTQRAESWSRPSLLRAPDQGVPV